ncbi:MAG: histidine--tRNA ligase [Armatimonadota bacterium]|nr:histidine--tRNA ligase [Armatimonadota bacterium]MDR7532377.1 histidine--tRNA ligase [Armatimonadota bacterium]MDR7535304.1 histidine--tRNA ligase [Armatimonadota bacterium]
MAEIQAPRGMRDILPGEVERWQALEARIHALAARYGFREIRTPVVEHTEVFQRTVGEATDIVEKEMYTFADRSGRSLSLRPEGTAGVVRAFLEHGLRQWPQPVKLYYLASMFRYDRPQKGRYRQHTQFGAEIIGSADPAADAEVLSLPVRLLQALGLAHVEVRLNSVGDAACRPRYLEALRAYVRPLLDELCADCRRRFERQPLRILECKQEGCRRVAAGAPAIVDVLCAPCAEHFAGVRAHLETLEIPYVLDRFIVRGMDYYTRTAFEVYSGRLGAQNAVFGGGRYDGLAEQLGGPPTPGVGFGLGLDRLLLVLEQEELAAAVGSGVQVMVVTVGDAARPAGLRLADELRAAGLHVEVDLLGRDVRAQMRHAHRVGAQVAAVLGDAELSAGVVTVRAMATGRQETVARDALVATLRARLGEEARR